MGEQNIVFELLRDLRFRLCNLVVRQQDVAIIAIEFCSVFERFRVAASFDFIKDRFDGFMHLRGIRFCGEVGPF